MFSDKLQPKLKGTVNVISSNPPFKDNNARRTAVPIPEKSLI